MRIQAALHANANGLLLSMGAPDGRRPSDQREGELARKYLYTMMLYCYRYSGWCRPPIVVVVVVFVGQAVNYGPAPGPIDWAISQLRYRVRREPIRWEARWAWGCARRASIIHICCGIGAA